MSLPWISAIASLVSAVGAAVAAVAAWKATKVAEGTLRQSEESENRRREAENQRRRDNAIVLAHRVVSDSDWLDELSRRVEQTFGTLGAFTGTYESGLLKKRKAELTELRKDIASRRSEAEELVANPKAINNLEIDEVGELSNQLFSELSFLHAKKATLEDELEELRTQVRQFRDAKIKEASA